MRPLRSAVARSAGLVGLAALGAAACDSTTRVDGRVVDAAGRPVRGAVVVLRREGLAAPGTGGADSTRADSAGGFGVILFGGLRRADAVLSVYGPGYARQERRVPDQARLGGLTVTLAEDGSTPGPDGGIADAAPRR